MDYFVWRHVCFICRKTFFFHIPLGNGKEECSGSVFVSVALSQLSDLEHFESAFVVLSAPVSVCYKSSVEKVTV